MGVGNRQRLQYGKTLTEGFEPFVINRKRKKAGGNLEIGKKILIAAGILIASFVLCLCVMAVIKAYNKSRSRDRIYVQQDVLEYLEKRYGEEFIVIYNRGMGYAYNYVQLYAYPKGYSDEKHKFEIQGYYNRWGKLDYYDSYVMVKLTDDYEAYVDPIIGEYFDEYKFYMEFNSEWLTSNIPPDTKLEDLWKLKANQDYPLPRINLFIKDDKDIGRLQLEKMVQELSKCHVRCAGYVAYITEEEKYDSLIDDWNENVHGLDFNNIETFLIYGENDYKFTSGGN